MTRRKFGKHIRKQKRPPPPKLKKVKTIDEYWDSVGIKSMWRKNPPFNFQYPEEM